LNRKSVAGDGEPGNNARREGQPLRRPLAVDFEVNENQGDAVEQEIARAF
jgi:hypothetical protein